MFGTVVSLLTISILAAATPAMVLGVVVYLFDQTAAMYTATAVFIWKFFDYVKLSIHCVRTENDETK
jgi:hypothetical protein